MYWYLNGNAVGGVTLLALLLSVFGGGWLLAGRAFDLASRERLVVGAGLGLVLLIWWANILGRWLSPALAFGLAAFVVIASGLAALRGRAGAGVRRKDFREWPWLLLMLGLVCLFTAIGRGLGVFDDRKALSIISTMAAGDIPPHFYMNWEFLFRYHYGFHVLGAILMKVGGLFPWSAYDLAKGLTAGLAVGLAGLWGRRAIPRWWGGPAVALLVLFASGARWALLMVPHSVLARWSSQIDLWGSGSQSAPTLLSGLGSTWGIDGGPPVDIAFAFVSGVLQPLIVHLQAGPKSLALVIFFLVLMLGTRARGGLAWPILTLVLSLWALAAEAEFVLFGLGALIATVALRPWRVLARWRSQVRPWLASLLAAAIISLVQGGTLTEVARGLLGNSAVAPTAAGSLGGFSLRLPPALVSAHLGEMPLHKLGPLLVGLLEFGPALALFPLVVWSSIRWTGRGRFLLLTMALSMVLGLLIPMFLRYEVDRDITRMTHYALLGWICLALPVLAAIGRLRPSSWFRNAVLTWGAATCLGGLMVLGPLLTAISKPVFSFQIAPVDAAMTRAVWDRLPSEATVLDSSAWRAVAVTGRLTRSSISSSETLESWRFLISAPEVTEVALSGFDYVYVDTKLWEGMPARARTSYGSACVNLVAEAHDNAANGSRWLFDVRRCALE